MQDAPILFIDADEDDQLLFQQILTELSIDHPVLIFSEAESALNYLGTTAQSPFLIICEMDMPRMNGLELRQRIEADPALRQKSIPFIFMTAPVEEHLVDQAYALTIQGLFEKKTSLQAWKDQLQSILAYWSECLHPKRFGR